MTETMIDAKTDFVTRFLNQTTTPAFYDGYQIITLSMKYDVDQRADGRYFVRESQNLSKAGFERNIDNNTCRDGSWAGYVTANGPADALRIQFTEAKAQAEAERLRKAEEELHARAEQYRKSAEHRASVDALVNAAKWTIDAYSIHQGDDKPRKGVKGKVFGLVGVRKDGSVWTVDHIPTGFAMGQFDSQTEAKIAAARFSQFDLNRTPAELGKDKALGDLARAMQRTSDAYAEVI